MTTLIIFLILSIVEFIIIFVKWNELTDLNSLGKIASDVLGVEKHYTSLIEKLVLFLIRFKPLLWVAVIVISLVNFLVAYIISTLIGILSFVTSVTNIFSFS